MIESRISPILQRLAEVVTQVHPALAKKLQPGLSAGEIDELLASARLQFTAELYTLFSWEDGVATTSGVTPETLQIFPMGIPFSLASAVGTYKTTSLKQHLFETNYFPLFYSGHGDMFLYDLDESSPTYSMISLYSPELLGKNTLETIYDTLASLLDTATTCYDKQIFRIDQDRLEFDSDGHYNVASELNPNSYYWQYM